MRRTLKGDVSMTALPTMFLAVLLWYIVGEFALTSTSWLGEIFPANDLVFPMLVLLLAPAVATAASLQFSRPRQERGLPRRLSHAHNIGMITAVVLWLGVLAFGNWFSLTRSRIPSDWPGMATALAFVPLVLGIGLSAIPISWWAHRRSASALMADFWDLCRPNALLLVPLTLLSGIEDWILLHPDRMLDIAWPPWLLLGLGIVAMILALPLLLNTMLSSRPIPAGPMREKLMDLAKRGHIRCGIPRIWNTGSRPIINAMITGLFPFQRRIYLTDQLLRVASDDEVEAVFAHELAHARQRHLWIYLLAALGFIFCWMLFDSKNPTVNELAGMGMIAIAFWFFFGRLSRHMEHQADIVSDELTGQPGAIAGALAHIAMLGGGLKQRGGWRHPAIVERIRVLHQYRENHLFRVNFRRHSRRLLLLVLALVTFSGLALLLEASDQPSHPPWQQKFHQGLSFLDAVDELRSRPGEDTDRADELLLTAQKWLKEGIQHLIEQDAHHPSLAAAYETLALIYDQLDQRWNATACRILATAARRKASAPD
ncbi:MAG: M48 family metalloprotease [Planctomycetota bacterium]|nr:M48 family metalloprotease [Planctomycetota bacterium]